MEYQFPLFLLGTDVLQGGKYKAEWNYADEDIWTAPDGTTIGQLKFWGIRDWCRGFTTGCHPHMLSHLLTTLAPRGRGRGFDVTVAPLLIGPSTVETATAAAKCAV